MSTASRIIDLFGGTRPAARKLELAVSTVQGWKLQGYIPAQRQQRVLDTARRHGIAVTPASFFENETGAHQAGDISMSEKPVQDEGGPGSPAQESPDAAAVIAG